eukprot:5412771-Pyramimonas_sp.AAC.1
MTRQERMIRNPDTSDHLTRRHIILHDGDNNEANEVDEEETGDNGGDDGKDEDEDDEGWRIMMIEYKEVCGEPAE